MTTTTTKWLHRTIVDSVSMSQPQEPMVAVIGYVDDEPGEPVPEVRKILAAKEASLKAKEGQS